MSLTCRVFAVLLNWVLQIYNDTQSCLPFSPLYVLSDVFPLYPSPSFGLPSLAPFLSISPFLSSSIFFFFCLARIEYFSQAASDIPKCYLLCFCKVCLFFFFLVSLLLSSPRPCSDFVFFATSAKPLRVYLKTCTWPNTFWGNVHFP